jgi:hypothetical protein
MSKSAAAFSPHFLVSNWRIVSSMLVPAEFGLVED